MTAKRTVALLLPLACMLGMTACGGGQKEEKAGPVVYPVYDESKEALLSAYLSPQKLDEEQFDWVKEAGLTHLYIDYTTSVDKMKYSIEQCDRIGVKAIPMTCWGRTALHSYRDYPFDASAYQSFAGYNILDEPFYEDMDYLASQYQLYKKDHPDKIFFTNCLRPNVGRNSLSVSKDKDYTAYMDAFIEKVMTPIEGERLMSMTLYPLLIDQKTGEKSIQDVHLLDLGMFSNAAHRAEADWVHFVQVTSFGGTHHTPTEADIRFQVYSGMAFGSKGFQYFTYATPNINQEFGQGDVGMINRNNSRTSLYYSVQAVNAEIAKFDHVFTSFNYKNTILIDGDLAKEPNPGFELYRNNSKVSSAESTEYLKNAICSQDTLIGVLEDEEGFDGYVAVNYTHPSAQGLSDEISLDFSGCRELIVYTKGEKSLITREDAQFKNGIFSATLAPGEGLFIIPLK